MTARAGKAFLAVGIAGTLLHLGFVALAPVGFLETRPVVDDTFYYWMIARRFWETGFFTFDGLNPTNGFQPLWQWMLLPLGLLAHDGQLRLSLLLAAGTYQAAAWLLALFPLRTPAWLTACRVAAVALWTNARFVFEYASSGMEFGLYLLVGVWALLECLRLLEDQAPRGLGRLLVATALLPLARVDGVGLSALLWAVLLFRSHRRLRLAVVVAGFASLVPFLAWMAWNQSVFASALPVSGTVKRLDRLYELQTLGISPLSGAWFLHGLRDSALLLGGNGLRFFSGWLPPGPWSRIAVVLVGAATGLALAGAVLAGERRHPDRTWGARLLPWVPAGLLLAFGLIQALVYCFLIPRGTQYAQWYYGPFYGGLALAVGAAWHGVGLASRLGVATRTALILFVLHFAALGILPQPVQVASAGAYAALEAADQAVSGDEPVLVGSWNAGLVAFRASSHLRVVNLDGLVNSTEYAHRHAAGADVRPYLAAQGIEWLVDYATEPEGWEDILIRRLGVDSGVCVVEATAAFIGPLPEQIGAEPRRYHLLRIAAHPSPAGH
jgi:hypothetical protein